MYVYGTIQTRGSFKVLYMHLNSKMEKELIFNFGKENKENVNKYTNSEAMILGSK